MSENGEENTHKSSADQKLLNIAVIPDFPSTGLRAFSFPSCAANRSGILCASGCFIEPTNRASRNRLGLRYYYQPQNDARIQRCSFPENAPGLPRGS